MVVRIIILFLITLASPTFAGEVIEAIYQEEVERAVKYAPPGMTPTQMRLAAQKRTNELFKKAAELYELPIFQITITWGLLRNDAAGETSWCDELSYFLSLL